MWREAVTPPAHVHRGFYLIAPFRAVFQNLPPAWWHFRGAIEQMFGANQQAPRGWQGDLRSGGVWGRARIGAYQHPAPVRAHHAPMPPWPRIAPRAPRRSFTRCAYSITHRKVSGRGFRVCF
jgi:hypothetical protein